MGKFRFILLFILILGLISGCTAFKKTIETISANELYVRYHYSSKVDYVNIEIKNNGIRATTLNENKLRAHWEQNPTWTAADLETIERDLTSIEIDILKKTIQDSGFFKLNDIEGVTEKDQKYEASTLKVTFESKTKTVEYRYNPSGPEMPEAYKKISFLLYNMAKLGK